MSAEKILLVTDGFMLACTRAPTSVRAYFSFGCGDAIATVPLSTLKSQSVVDSPSPPDTNRLSSSSNQITNPNRLRLAVGRLPVPETSPNFYLTLPHLFQTSGAKAVGIRLHKTGRFRKNQLQAISWELVD